MSNQILDYIGSTITIYLELLAYNKISNSNKLKISFKNISIILLSGLLVTLNLYNNAVPGRAIISFSILIISSLIIFDDEIAKTIYYTLICYLISVIYEILLSIILTIFNIVDFNSFDINSIVKAIFSLSIFIMMCLTVSINRVKSVINIVLDKLKYNRLVLAILFVSLVALILLDFTYLITFSKGVYIGNIIIVISIIILIVINVYNHIRVKQEIGKIESLLKFISKYEKIIDDDRINRHEMLNNLLILKTIENKNSIEFENTLDELIQTYNKNKIGIKNISKLPNGLKGMFYYKLYGLQEEGYNVDIHISQQIGNMFKKIDNKQYLMICKIIGILLDNAIEASSKTRNKLIIIDTYKDKNNIIISISNSFKGSINLDKINKKYYSTKGKNRGLGLYLINDALTRMNNIKMEQSVNNRLFNTKIIIKRK